MKCNRCGKDNPPDLHTCTPIAMRYVDELRRHGTVLDHAGCAAEIVRLYEENVRLEQALKMEEAVSFRKQLNEVQAENEALRAQLQWVLLIHNDPTLAHERDIEIWGPEARAALAWAGEKR
jgi:hypothetical protein